jgi:hypothetical protein
MLSTHDPALQTITLTFNILPAAVMMMIIIIIAAYLYSLLCVTTLVGWLVGWLVAWTTN